ncbi:SHOCT domain-containing protein [Antarcticibacterium arcticum]|uniref:SHOCT domain-containing protein n=1 Tax=Antarcticibacterium arcticum TaxID=2585771 RepID=A0A5B8YI87_9FLAO|nr:SHOCT domain-containing protein [Antarcticibacterium arcticum]QED37331.1 SHOCT domain-containing protein [Antarcticibacterium arcticum]
MSEPVIFKSSYFLRTLNKDLNPFTPNVLVIDEEHIEFKRRNWHLISEDTETLHFKNITGVTVDSHMLGTTITIKSTGTDPILVRGFWKKEAKEIKELCAKYIALQNQKNSGEAVANSLAHAMRGSTRNLSVADELSKLRTLMDQGVLTREEFEEQKRKLLQD